MTFDSTLFVPNQSMSGFCTTCHGKFHSPVEPDEDGANYRPWSIDNGRPAPSCVTRPIT